MAGSNAEAQSWREADRRQETELDQEQERDDTDQLGTGASQIQNVEFRMQNGRRRGVGAVRTSINRAARQGTRRPIHFRGCFPWVSYISSGQGASSLTCRLNGDGLRSGVDGQSAGGPLGRHPGLRLQSLYSVVKEQRKLTGSFADNGYPVTAFSCLGNVFRCLYCFSIQFSRSVAIKMFSLPGGLLRGSDQPETSV